MLILVAPPSLCFIIMPHPVGVPSSRPTQFVFHHHGPPSLCFIITPHPVGVSSPFLTELVLHRDLVAVDLPAVGLGTEAEDGRLVLLRGGVDEVDDEAVGLRRVMMDELGEGGEPVVDGDVHLQQTGWRGVVTGGG